MEGEPEEGCGLGDGDGGDAAGEFPVFRLVVEDMHAKEGADVSRKEGREEKVPFGNPPAVMDGFPFVPAEEEKGKEVHPQKEKDFFFHSFPSKVRMYPPAAFSSSRRRAASF